MNDAKDRRNSLKSLILINSFLFFSLFFNAFINWFGQFSHQKCFIYLLKLFSSCKEKEFSLDLWWDILREWIDHFLSKNLRCQERIFCERILIFSLDKDKTRRNFNVQKDFHLIAFSMKIVLLIERKESLFQAKTETLMIFIWNSIK